MTLIDILIGLIVAAAIGGAVMYIVREKKKGVMCIGCPESGTCAMKGKGGCGCPIPEDFKIEK